LRRRIASAPGSTSLRSSCCNATNLAIPRVSSTVADNPVGIRRRNQAVLLAPGPIAGRLEISLPRNLTFGKIAWSWLIYDPLSPLLETESFPAQLLSDASGSVRTFSIVNIVSIVLRFDSV
jgi:LSD1 subclass zinc finger protein